MSTAANTLRTLHRIHQQLGDLRERHDRGPKQVNAHRQNVAKNEQDLHQAHEAVKQAKMAADQKQLLLKTGEGKIADLRRKLNESQSNREYQALLVQIAADEMAKSVLEDEILDVFGKIDELQTAILEAERRFARAKEELTKTDVAVREQATLIQGDLTRLEVDLKTAETGLPGEFRDIYLRVVKSKGSDGMAKVENDCCGGCFQSIQPNRMNQLFMEHAVLCTSCGRLLYLPEELSVGRRR